LNEDQGSKVAHIVAKETNGVNFVNNGEVEVDLKNLSNSVLREIDEYLKNVESSADMKESSDSSVV
jgi:hypothetical protein